MKFPHDPNYFTKTFSFDGCSIFQNVIGDVVWMGLCKNKCMSVKVGVGVKFEMNRGSEVFTGRWAEDKGVSGQRWLLSKLGPCCCCACLRSWAKGCKFGVTPVWQSVISFCGADSYTGARITSVHQCLSGINICGSFHGTSETEQRGKCVWLIFDASKSLKAEGKIFLRTM